MDIFKKFLKYWFMLSSVIGFLTGWVFIAQSSEAELAGMVGATSTQSQTITLQPVPSLDSLVGNQTPLIAQDQVQPFTIVQSQTFQPQMRTGGS